MKNILAPALFLLGTGCPSIEEPNTKGLGIAEDVLSNLNKRCGLVFSDPDSVWEGTSKEPNFGNGAFGSDLRSRNLLGRATHGKQPNTTNCACSNGEFRFMIPEETLHCSSGTFGETADSNFYSVMLGGIGLPVPKGAVHDPRTGSTTDNDGTYALQYVWGDYHLKGKGVEVNITIHPDQETAIISTTEDEVHSEQIPIDYQKAVGLRIRTLTDLESLRQKFDPQ